jgi:lysophospholipase L1-like esterase
MTARFTIRGATGPRRSPSPLAFRRLVSPLVLATTVAVASAGQPSGKYVALGSSYASGPLIPEVADAACLRSTNDYPHLVAARLGLELTDVTCSGATTDHIISIAQGANPPQIDAVTPDTSIVTVTIGGNDVRYSGSALACGASGLQHQSCLGSQVDPQDIQQRLAGLEGKLLATFDRIRAAAPTANIFMVSYFRMLPPRTGPCPPSVPMLPQDEAFVERLGRSLQRISKRAAHRAKVVFVDTYREKHHDACAPPAQRWVEGEVPASPALMFHPNAAGMRAAADLIVRKIRRAF